MNVNLLSVGISKIIAPNIPICYYIFSIPIIISIVKFRRAPPVGIPSRIVVVVNTAIIVHIVRSVDIVAARRAKPPDLFG